LITKLKFIINFLPLLSQVFKTFLVLVIPRHKTEKWQATYHLDLVQRGHEFLIEQDPFLQIMATQLHVLKKLSPVAWWKTQGPIGRIDQNTIDFAIKMLSLPPGSADIERHFSTMGSIMSTQRPWLGIKKAEKLSNLQEIWQRYQRQ
jgi:hypothetical protein